MKKFAWLFCVAIAMAMPAHTQTFLDHLRKNEPGKGTVTVTQSKEIDELVNGSKQTKPQVTNNSKKEIVKNNATTNKTEAAQKETKKPQQKARQSPLKSLSNGTKIQRKRRQNLPTSRKTRMKSTFQLSTCERK